MLNNIIIGLFAFLLALFPNSLGLRASYQSRTFDMNASISVVMDAVKTGDTAKIEALMCKNIKQNVPNLSAKISDLVDAIDGNIVEYRWERGSSFLERRNDGRQISQQSVFIDFKTSDGDYLLVVNWEIVCNFAPEETGIRRIALYSGSTYDPSKAQLAEIMALEGWGGWHN